MPAFLEAKLKKQPRPWLNKKSGYLYLMGPDCKKLLAHRVVWEKAYGPIPENHQIHHKNHIRTDNRLENLELIERHAHMRMHHPRTKNFGCTVEGCTNKAYARDFCSKHYWRWKKYGDPTTLTKGMKKLCIIAGCTNNALARGWCGKHYMRWLVHGDPEFRLTIKQTGTCTYCAKPYVTRNMCEAHYTRWRRGTLYGSGVVRAEIA